MALVVYLGLLIPVEDKALAEYDGVEIIMQKIADTLNEINADIVLLQEVDIESKRSGFFMDQMQFLLDNTNLNYGAYAPVMEVDFVFQMGLVELIRVMQFYQNLQLQMLKELSFD